MTRDVAQDRLVGRTSKFPPWGTSAAQNGSPLGVRKIFSGQPRAAHDRGNFLEPVVDIGAFLPVDLHADRRARSSRAAVSGSSKHLMAMTWHQWQAHSRRDQKQPVRPLRLGEGFRSKGATAGLSCAGANRGWFGREEIAHLGTEWRSVGG
jgi:hypothetical protein